ncbi:MAG: MerR family transcriptional regulator [Acetatifactor sp.]|nr:MerR family transcriptional regulator [Acetatifactor sp.]
MTIREIEKESGMVRANIRYYESEGLLAPARESNRYRDYSEEDLEVLKRIRLLRSLQFSLEEIKDLQSGRQELSEVLDRQIIKLQREKKKVEHSQEICRVMRDDGVSYQTLNAQHYLGILEQEVRPVVPEQDALPEAHTPWRRYFARSMDLLLYSVIWDVFLALVMGVNISMRSAGGKILDKIVILSVMLFVEPVLLALFGTTPGKWILGLRVTDNAGECLTFEEARARTWKVCLHGMGLSIPIWSIVRMWKSYKVCVEEETQEWEYHSAVTLKDERGWRTAAYLGACIFCLAVFVFAFGVSILPKNRGDITVAEFSENYNRYTKFYGYDSTYYLDKEGKWVQERCGYGNTIVIGGHDEPVYRFSETDGIMTGMSFSVKVQGSDDWISDYRKEMILSILAFAGAQKDNTIFSREIVKAVSLVREAPFENFDLSVYGIRVTCEIAYSGYYTIPGSGMLVHTEGEESRFSLSFSMKKEEE